MAHSVYLGAMSNPLPVRPARAISILRGFLEPIIGSVFTLLWINAESGRQDVAIVAMCAIGLAIALSMALPLIAMGLTALVILCQAVTLLPRPTSTDWPVYFGVAIVVGIAATGTSARVRWIALGFGAVAAIAAVAMMVFQADGWMSWTGYGDHIRLYYMSQDFVQLAALGVVVSSLAWGSGFAISATRRLMLSQQVTLGVTRRLALSEVELAVAQERNRIAQEMHDVLAHSLAVVVAQADGARYLRPTRPAAVDGALQTIADSARMALGDMRGVIDGILDGTEQPQPRLSDLESLVSGMASTGMKVTLREIGDRADLADGQELALYRIVQEGLTNALRHRGRDSAVGIVLDWRGPGVSLLLESTGGVLTETTEADRCGRGVMGMRERAHVAGGWLTVGLEEDGTHRLTAFLPYYSARARLPELVG